MTVVPVLPATLKPSTFARLAVPLTSTTVASASRILSAVSGLITLRTYLLIEGTSFRAVIRHHRLQQLWLHQQSAIGNGRISTGNLQGRHTNVISI